jgi:hypothetical protein
MSHTAQRRIFVLLLAVGVMGVQAGTYGVWWDVSQGISLYIAELLLVLALLAGVRIEKLFRHRRAEGGEERRPRVPLALVALAVSVVLGYLSYRFAVTDQSAKCGSPIEPLNVDCLPAGRNGLNFLAALGSLVFAGWAMSGLRLRRVHVPGVVVGLAVAVGIGLMALAIPGQPRDYPAFNTAPEEVARHNERFLSWALDQVTSAGRHSALLLALGVAVLAPLAVAKREHGVQLPLPAVLVGLFATAVAALSATVLWVFVIADFMSGP